mmetsp:Transcript_54327/g.65371  ORF Transcript_54327/g.65371 Transcript_54327/m.65371 type:complete len:86 (+) Transcript_54327:327-584(+)
MKSNLIVCDLSRSRRANNDMTYTQIEEQKSINLNLAHLASCVSEFAAYNDHNPFRDNWLTKILRLSFNISSWTVFRFIRNIHFLK